MKPLIRFLLIATALVMSFSAFADGTRKIVKLTPENGATDVALSTTEISIEFDKPMANTSSLFADCNTGICYKNGSWKTPTLFVVTDVKLIPGRTYTLGIGNKKTGQQNFGAEGVPLPPVDWTFTAAAE